MKDTATIKIKVPATRERALMRLAVNRGDSNVHNLLNLAIERTLENGLSKKEVWLPDNVDQWLNQNGYDLYEIVKERLASEIFSAYQNGNLDLEETQKLATSLGFKMEEL